jgi:pimeloyl-ACP methyl ester carboxylesterase
MNGLSRSVTANRTAASRLLRLGALIAAALTLSLVFLSTSAQAVEPKPTVVLVHGAFASPAGWDRVADGLGKDGYQTATPALGLESLAGDVAIVQATLDSIPGAKILVGHSSGPRQSAGVSGSSACDAQQRRDPGGVAGVAAQGGGDDAQRGSWRSGGRLWVGAGSMRSARCLLYESRELPERQAHSHVTANATAHHHD